MNRRFVLSAMRRRSPAESEITRLVTRTESPKIFDLSKESPETLALYGVGQQPTHDYGRRCLLARKLVEHGVRFVCVVAGGGPGNMQWDAHNDIEENHLRKAAERAIPRLRRRIG